MFASQPEMVMGLGGLDTMHDGRDIYDNIQLIFKYPKGKKMIWSGSSTTSHLPLFGGARAEQGEMITGTQGTVHITIGDGRMDPNPPVAVWYKEPNPPKVAAANTKEKFQAGASFSLASGTRALPVLLTGDAMTGKESFLEKELKFARQWLYAKNIMVPQESKNPVTTSLEHFFNDIRSNNMHPRANFEIGLEDSTSVILSNRAMDEERRVLYSEMHQPNGAPAVVNGKKKT
jgi:hypothetical protein